MKGIGIGCFHFGVAREMFPEFTAKRYAEEVEKAINQIANVSDLKVSSPDEYTYNYRFDRSNMPKFEQGDDWFPVLGYLNIVFNVFIPTKLQEQYLGESFRSKPVPENFLVTIHNDRWPIAYVSLLCEDFDEYPPSKAVLIVRKYLEEEIGKQKGRIRFEKLGPSPFHANIYVDYYRSETNKSNFAIRTEKRQGYGSITFLVHRDIYSDEKLLISKFHKIVEPEISLYYMIIHFRARQFHLWENIQDLTTKIVETGPTFLRWLKSSIRFVSKGYRINKLFESLISFKVETLQKKESLAEMYRYVYSIPRNLKEFIDQEYNNPPLFPVSEIFDLLYFKESRVSKFWELVALLIAAIMGGVVGSLLTHHLSAINAINNAIK